MPEQLKKSDFEVEVATNLGWGRGEDNDDTAWTDVQKAQLRGFVSSGYSLFLNTPELVDAKGNVFHPGNYKWSFLRPVVSLTLQSGKQALDLPDDYEGLEGNVCVADGASIYSPLQWRGLPAMEALYATSDSAPTGAPQFFCERWKKTDGSAGQKAELFVYPEADQAYTLRVQYYLTPDALSDTHPYAYGGALHSQTIKYACLAAAELDLDGDPMGPMRQEFLRRLKTSIMADLNSKPAALGKNLDPSESGWPSLRAQHAIDSNFTVTFDSTDPG
jgi:hypothetical protein